MQPTTWIVQNKLHPTAGADTKHLIREACLEVGRPMVEIEVVSGIDPLKEFGRIDPPFVLYGYATLIDFAFKSATWKEGVFFDPELFRPSVYAARYGADYLNFDLGVMSVEAFASRDVDPASRFFVRPNDDAKAWTGKVSTFGDLLANILPGSTSGNQQIAVCSPKDIVAEWRVFIVDGLRIASCQYRPEPQRWVPPEVEQFAQRMAAQWTPVPVVVMDVAETSASLKVIELNCFNGSAFYLAEVASIIRHVSVFLES